VSKPVVSLPAPSTAASKPKPPLEPGIESLPAAEQRFRGQAIIDAQGLALSVCGEKSQRQVVLEAQAQATIDSFIAVANSAKSRPFFLDAWGARRNDGGLRLGRIERVYREGPGCAEDMSEFVVKASGNEPFWALSIDRSILRFQRPEAPAYSGSYTRSLLADGSSRFEADTEGGRLTVTLTRRPCRDGMSDAVFGWAAVVRVGQREWGGCGYVGVGNEDK
jgi:putative lipoprotein